MLFAELNTFSQIGKKGTQTIRKLFPLARVKMIQKEVLPLYTIFIRLPELLGCFSQVHCTGRKLLRRAVCRAVARAENPGEHVIQGGDNVPPLVEIGLTGFTY